jgi:cytochrome c6
LIFEATIEIRKSQLKKIITLGYLIFTMLIMSLSSNALAVETSNAAEIFTANCAGCHLNGGNIVRRGKNLKQKALKKHHMDSIDAIANLVENGKNAMPAYKERLSNQQIIDVAGYVLDQAEKGWN